MGGQYRLNKASVIDVGVAYLYLRDTPISNNQTASTPSRGLVNGSYDGSVWILGAQYSHAF